MEYLNGIPIIVSNILVETKQVRFPRTKKKRIKKKFAKDKRNFRTVPSRNIIKTQFSIIMHPTMLEEFKRALHEGKRKLHESSDQSNHFANLNYDRVFQSLGNAVRNGEGRGTPYGVLGISALS